jgi:hypothetical protein
MNKYILKGSDTSTLHLGLPISGLCLSANIFNEHNVWETGSVFVLWWKDEEVSAQMGPLERANLQ